MKELGLGIEDVEQRAMGETMTTATVDRSGWILYATTMFVIIGVMDIIYGLTMIINNEWLVFGAATVWYINLAAWGWITLLIGVLGLAVAGGIYSGQTWARVLGVIAAGLTAIDAFFIMPYYPVWALAILAMSMLVIWAVTAHGDEAF